MEEQDQQCSKAPAAARQHRGARDGAENSAGVCEGPVVQSATIAKDLADIPAVEAGSHAPAAANRPAAAGMGAAATPAASAGSATAAAPASDPVQGGDDPLCGKASMPTRSASGKLASTTSASQAAEATAAAMADVASGDDPLGSKPRAYSKAAAAAAAAAAGLKLAEAAPADGGDDPLCGTAAGSPRAATMHGHDSSRKAAVAAPPAAVDGGDDPLCCAVLGPVDLQAGITPPTDASEAAAMTAAAIGSLVLSGDDPLAGPAASAAAADSMATEPKDIAHSAALSATAALRSLVFSGDDPLAGSAAAAGNNAGLQGRAAVNSIEALLLQQLIGSADQAKAAVAAAVSSRDLSSLSALLVTLGSDDKAVADAAASYMAQKCSGDVQQEVAQAVTRMAVQVLNSSSSSSRARQCAARALQQLACWPAVRPFVADTPGCMEALLQAVQSADHQLQYEAIEAVRKLVTDAGSCRAAVEMGYVPVLVQRLGSSNNNVRGAALETVVNMWLAEGLSTSVEAAVTGPDGIPHLLQQLTDLTTSSSSSNAEDSSGGGCTVAQLAAADGLLLLASSPGKAWVIGTEHSGYALLEAMCSDSSQLQVKALKIATDLASSVQHTTTTAVAAAAAVESGYMFVLIQLLITGDDAAQDVAAKAIVSLATSYPLRGVHYRQHVWGAVERLLGVLHGTVSSCHLGLEGARARLLAAVRGLQLLIDELDGGSIMHAFEAAAEAHQHPSGGGFSRSEYTFWEALHVIFEALLLALHDADIQMQTGILQTVSNLTLRDSRAAYSAVHAGFMPVLGQLLGAADDRLQTAAVDAIRSIASSNIGLHAVLASGGVSSLLEQLRTNKLVDSSSTSSINSSSSWFSCAGRFLCSLKALVGHSDIARTANWDPAHGKVLKLQAAKGLSKLAAVGLGSYGDSSLTTVAGPQAHRSPGSVAVGAQVILQTPGSIAALLESLCSACVPPESHTYTCAAKYILDVLGALVQLPEFDAVAAAAAASWAAYMPMLEQHTPYLLYCVKWVKGFGDASTLKSVVSRLMAVAGVPSSTLLAAFNEPTVEDTSRYVTVYAPPNKEWNKEWKHF